jgi:PAS domain S-box-containing protein
VTKSAVQNPTQLHIEYFSLRLLRRTIGMLLLLTALHILFLLLIPQQPTVPLLLDGALMLALVGGYGMVYLQRLRIARAWVVLLLWLYSTCGSILLGGIQNPIAGGYIVFVLVVGLLYTVRHARYAFMLSVCSLLSIFVAGSMGWLPVSAVDLTPRYIWLNMLVNTIVVIQLVYFLLTSIQHAADYKAQQRDNNLTLLHDVIRELTASETLDDVFRNTITLGRSKLEYDRLALFLYDDDSHTMVGTYGTDGQGNVRNESYLLIPITESGFHQYTLNTHQTIILRDDAALEEDGKVVGRGWHLLITLWDSDKVMGWMVADNLLTQKPLDPAKIDLLYSYSVLVIQLVIRKQAENQLRYLQRSLQAKSESLAAINKMAERLHQTHDMESVLKSVADALISLLNTQSVLVYLLSEDKQRLHLALDVNSLIPTPTELDVASSLTGYVVTHKTVVISDDFLEDDRLSSAARKHLGESDVSFIVFIPIVFGETVLGTIVLGFTTESRTETSDYQTYAAIGQTVGLALSNVRFVSEIQLEKEFSDSIIESIPNIFYMFAETGELVRWNANLETLLGYDSEKLGQMSPPALVSAADEFNMEALLQKTLANGSASAYLHLTTHDRQEVPYIFSTRRYAMNGKQYVIGTGIDLSDRMQLLEQLQYQTTQLHTAGDISKSIVTVLATNDLLQYTVDLVCQRFDYYYVGIFMADKESNAALLSAGSGSIGREMLRVGHRLTLDNQSMIGRCIVNAESLIAANIELEDGHFANPFLPDTRSEMALPLVNRGEVLGAISVQSKAFDAFSNDDIAVMRFIADHLTSALVNARLYEIITRRQRYLGILRHITQRAMPERDMKVFMHAIVKALAQEFQYMFAGIFMADYADEMLDVVAYVDEEKIDISAHRWSFHEGILGWVVRNKQPYLCRDSSKDPLYFSKTKHTSIRSVVITPIWEAGVVSGVLVINQRNANTLDELDLEIATELSIELGLHMENIRLYAQTQQNAEDLERQVEARTSQMQAVNRELEAFAYSVSHDLRAPLRSIDGFSQALLEDYFEVIDEGGKNFLRRIRASSQRMGQLIDDLLTLSRVTRRDFKQQQVDLSAMATEIIDILQLAEPQRQVQVIIEAGITAMGDARMLRIALENLLGNAWKFTATKSAARIEFASTKQDDEIIYRVSDNGVGFNMDYADKLFIAFQRLHAMNEFEGTGIGLATVKRVLERHGGRIWVDAKEGEGATFFFTIGKLLPDE